MDYHNTLFSRRKNSRMGQTVLRLVMLHLEQWPLRRPRQKKAPCQLFPLLSIHEQEIAMWLQPKSRGPVKCRGENDSWHKPALPQLGMFLCVIDPGLSPCRTHNFPQACASISGTQAASSNSACPLLERKWGQE